MPGITSIFSEHSKARSFDDGVDYPDKIESHYEIKSDLSDYKIDILLENDESRTICYRYNGYEISFTQSIVKGYDVNYNTENADIGAQWRKCESWSATYYGYYCYYTNSRSVYSGNQYRVKSEFKVYSGSSYENITVYSSTVST